MRIPYHWLKEFVDLQQSPAELAHALTMSGIEVESIDHEGGEPVLVLGLTPNRGDCLSIRGTATEVAAILEKRLTWRAPKVPRGVGVFSELLSVTVEDSTACLRYCARAIRGVRVGPSPEWLERRLRICGVRPINNIVDATNFVMLEMGQPLHAFDVARLRGQQIIVRRAAAGEHLRMLDGQRCDFAPDDLLICDAGGPLALAGIMGGDHSSVSESTEDVLLESASFDSATVRRAARRLGVHTESSRRFERGVDAHASLIALHRLTQVIVQIAGGTPTSDWEDLFPHPRQPHRVRLELAEVEQMLGVQLSLSLVVKILARLGVRAVSRGKVFAVLSVPTSRPDLTRSIDLIEEFARLYGYDRIPAVMPTLPMRAQHRPRNFMLRRQLRSALRSRGFSEAVLLPFCAVDAEKHLGTWARPQVHLQNPLSQESGALQASLLPNMLNAVQRNRSRQVSDVRLMALQHVFQRNELGEFQEPLMLCGCLLGQRDPEGWEQGRVASDAHDLKGVVQVALRAAGLALERIRFVTHDIPDGLHPGASAQVYCDDVPLGWMGMLHPEAAAAWDFRGAVLAFELNVDAIWAARPHALPRYRPIPPFPHVDRDVAFVLDNAIPFDRVQQVVRSAAGPLLAEVRLFDVYCGKGIPAGKKSLAISLRYQSSDRTLTDDEVTAVQERVQAALAGELGGELRTA